MLADPELGEAQLLGPDDQLQVLVVALGRRLGGVVERHDEHAVADRLRVMASYPVQGSWEGDRGKPNHAHWSTVDQERTLADRYGHVKHLPRSSSRANADAPAQVNQNRLPC